ncbi:MAG: formate--tetrahydrofolate ligase, partial [Dehalococcoidia bacterium]
MRPIADVAGAMGLAWDDLEPRGRAMAKVPLSAFPATAQQAKLIVVTAITPTPEGEGKTTMTLGLTDGLNHIGRRAIA